MDNMDSSKALVKSEVVPASYDDWPEGLIVEASCICRVRVVQRHWPRLRIRSWRGTCQDDGTLFALGLGTSGRRPGLRTRAILDQKRDNVQLGLRFCRIILSLITQIKAGNPIVDDC
jgi:hypothetical protein